MSQRLMRVAGRGLLLRIPVVHPVVEWPWRRRQRVVNRRQRVVRTLVVPPPPGLRVACRWVGSMVVLQAK
jgi:hypothetical protein